VGRTFNCLCSRRSQNGTSPRAWGERLPEESLKLLGTDRPHARGENIEGPRTYTTVDHPFETEPHRPLERIAVLEPDYVLVPIIMCERLAEANIKGIVETDVGADSELQIYDVQATYLGCGAVDRPAR
jgi:hypothetical protein